LPVGGIKEKILAAKRAGIKEIILCSRNKKDIDEISPRYLKNLKINYVQTVDEVIEKASNSILDKIKGLFPKKDDSTPNNNSNKANMDATKFAALFAVLNLTAMESTKDGVHMSMEQAEQINTALADAVKAKADMTAAQTERDSVLTALNEIDPTVAAAEGHAAKVTAVKAKLAAKPGKQPTGNGGGDGGSPSADGVDWDAINNLPHNQAADQVV